ncbi:MAG: PhoD-like phosphatase [Coleofasciculaceae cyanobacterium]
MSWIPLSDRLEHLPLILAGPILRRTDSSAVTVWVALKEPREVTLKVYATDSQGSRITTLLLEGTHLTIPVGQQLHIVAVTAIPVQQQQLEPGQIYAYDLSFGSFEQNLIQGINFPNSGTIPFAGWGNPQPKHSLPTTAAPVTVSYFSHQLPTFTLPPNDLNNLRLAHGSCRKLHSPGKDALPILDDLIKHDAHQPDRRLHQLFFTGDQIYADDVANPVLWVAMEVASTLLGWEELLPLQPTSPNSYEYKRASELKPGQRTSVAQLWGGLTAMVSHVPEEAKSHLFSFGEYLATYLLFWSPILWPSSLPEGKDVHFDSKQASLWEKEIKPVKESLAKLWQVRRAMANVPIYMVFDDHDITDDWSLNLAWCNSVFGKPLGKRVIQNGLLAYTLCQGWGNTPEQFQEGQPGENLLKAVTNWSASQGTDQSALEEIAKCLGLPQLEVESGLPKFKLDEDVLVFDRSYSDGTEYLKWHYTVRSCKHEVIVLDTRTWRGYPISEHGTISPPMLLSPTAFKEQIQKPLELTDQLKQSSDCGIEITFVVLPTNLVSIQMIDLVQRLELEKGQVFQYDIGDAWNLNEVAFSKLLAELFRRRQRVIVLSGDIHFGYSVRLSYWSGAQVQTPEQELVNGSNDSLEQKRKITGVLTQLTASPFKNDELKTHLIHTKVKSLLPESPQDWAGWNRPPQLVETQVIQGKICRIDVEMPAKGLVTRRIGNEVQGNYDILWKISAKDDSSLPDWQYHIDWIRREKAVLAPWENKQKQQTPPEPKNTSWLNPLLMLWRNRWLQEGEEIVGRNNFGVVSLIWPENNQEEKAVIQESYWHAPWQPSSVVSSQYFVSLQVDELPEVQLKAEN